MFKTMLRGRRTAVLTATATAAVIGGAGAYAAIPSETGEISSCYSTTTGALRVVDSAKPACATNEKALVFAQRGPTGPTGPRGPKGDPGPARAYWAKFSGTNKLIAASERPAAYYAYGQYGYNYVWFRDVDLSKCSVNVTIGTVDNKYRGVTGNYYNHMNQYVLAYAADASGQFVPNLPMDVLVNCSDTTFIPG